MHQVLLFSHTLEKVAQKNLGEVNGKGSYQKELEQDQNIVILEQLIIEET